jgi:multidrug resistance efflux pump
MNLDDIQAHLDRIFASRQGSTREQASMLREALLEFKIGIGRLREALEQTERQLADARHEVVVYERRGTLAAGIADEETRAVAEEFTLKARERVDILERKALVQRDELIMAERDYEATKARFQAAKHGVPTDAPAPDPLADPERMSPFEQVKLDQRAKEAVVDAQLEMLKKKLGERP